MIRYIATLVIAALCCAMLLSGCGGGSQDSIDQNPDTTQEVATAFHNVTAQPVHCAGSTACH